MLTLRRPPFRVVNVVSVAGFAIVNGRSSSTSMLVPRTATLPETMFECARSCRTGEGAVTVSGWSTTVTMFQGFPFKNTVGFRLTTTFLSGSLAQISPPTATGPLTVTFPTVAATPVREPAFVI